MEINIIGGGPADLLPDLTDYNNQNAIWVGVDRGVYYLLSKNLQPYASFGDFDSVTNDEYNKIENQVSNIQRYKPEKDETDMELALNWALEQNPSKIRIFGGTGGRLDHFFANIQLLIKSITTSNIIEIELIDLQNIIYIKSPGTYSIEKMKDKKYISFVPTTLSVEGLTLEGFKYPLKNSHIPMGSTLCISNELSNSHGTFSFNKGILMVIRSQDSEGLS